MINMQAPIARQQSWLMMLKTAGVLKTGFTDYGNVSSVCSAHYAFRQ